MPGRKFALTNDDIYLARRLREYRTKLRLTQEEVAARAGVSARTLKRIEAGEARIAIPVLRQLERALPGLTPRGDIYATGEVITARDMAAASERLRSAHDRLQVSVAHLREILAVASTHFDSMSGIVSTWAATPAPDAPALTLDEQVLLSVYRAIPADWRLSVQRHVGTLFRRFKAGLPRHPEAEEPLDISLEEALLELHMDELEVDEWTGELVDKDDPRPRPGDGETFVNRPAAEVRDLAQIYETAEKQRKAAGHA